MVLATVHLPHAALVCIPQAFPHSLSARGMRLLDSSSLHFESQPQPSSCVELRLGSGVFATAVAALEGCAAALCRIETVIQYIAGPFQIRC